MAKIEQRGIEKIQCGRIDFYIPLMFETKYDFNDICGKIDHRLDEDISGPYSDIEQDYQDFLEDKEDELRGKLSVFQRIRKFDRDRRRSKRCEISRKNMNNVIEIESTDKGIRITLSNKELEVFKDKQNDFIRMYDKYKEIYGLKFTSSQYIFVLLPLHIQLNNGEYVWLNSVLFIFQNKMGILKLELPLSNVSVQPLMEYRYDDFIKNIESPWFMNIEFKENSIEYIQEAYENWLIKGCGINVKQMGSAFRNIILSDFDGMPKQIRNIPNAVMVDLYRIIAAPLEKMDCTSYEKEAWEYIEKHQWVKHNSKYICSTTGGCLSITDIAFRDFFLDKYKQEWDVTDFEEQDIKYVYEKVVGNLCLNVEYAIIIIVLKYALKEFLYEMLLKKPKAMHDIRREYNVSSMFISELQEGCFGTVSEQIETFERVMPYYLKEDITSNKLKALDNVLNDEETKRRESLQNIIGFGGLMMAALFGLPAIYETLSILRSICNFITFDIPMFTLKTASTLVWFIVLCILSYALNRSRNRRK